MKTYILISVCLSSLIWLAADNINDTDSISRVQISDENKQVQKMPSLCNLGMLLSFSSRISRYSEYTG